jgi:hypothetical protein
LEGGFNLWLGDKGIVNGKMSIILHILTIPLEFIDERNDFDWHDTSEHDDMEPRTPHDSREEHTVDGHDTIMHGAERIKSIRSLDVIFLVDDACVPIKIQNIEGNR